MAVGLCEFESHLGHWKSQITFLVFAILVFITVVCQIDFIIMLRADF